MRTNARFGQGLSVAVVSAIALVSLSGCARTPLVSSNLPLKRVVIYRNGVGYFERAGHVDESEVRFKMKDSEVGDFLATLAVMEQGGSSVRAAAFPLDLGDDEEDAPAGAPKRPKTEDEKRGLKTVVLSLDGKAHDLNVGYITESPVWRPSYRLVVNGKGEADLQAWGIVQNLSGEDWKNVKLSLIAGAPLAFESQLGTPVIPTRPVVTDEGEVISAVPHGETSLAQEDSAPSPPAPAMKASESVSMEALGGLRGPAGSADSGGGARARPKKAALGGAPMAGAPAPVERRAEAPRLAPSPPRNLSSLAAVAIEGGATRYDLPEVVTVPDRSATMVMLVSKRVPGDAMFLFAPDGGVPDSQSHPFRIARFANRTGGVLERGPIAVFEAGSFLGQGMVDPLPVGATASVPFALERALAVERGAGSYRELGARLAKIENGQLTVESDGSTVSTYKVRNGADTLAKVIVKHPRLHGTRLFQPPKETEDNLGSGSALVPSAIPAHGTGEVTIDERATIRRVEDWFSTVAANAMKAYVDDNRAEAGIATKLRGVLTTRGEVIHAREARSKLAHEQSSLSEQTEETRRNLRAIEKNKLADQLRAKLTARLAESATRLDEITKSVVELEAKEAELSVRLKEAVREITLTDPPPALP